MFKLRHLFLMLLLFGTLASAGSVQAQDSMGIETWQGTYSNTQGTRVTDSEIFLDFSGLRSGDWGTWDGAPIMNLRVNGNKREWMHYSIVDGEYVDVYFVTATVTGEQMTVTYTKYAWWLFLLGEPSGIPEDSRPPIRYTGSGTFRRL